MTQVFIVSDVRLYRESLEQYLADKLGLAVEKTGRQLTEISRQIDGSPRPVVLVDMSSSEAIDACRDAAEIGAFVVALGLPPDEGMLMACADIGVQGYICRAASLEDLERAVRRAGSDRPYCDDWVSAFALRCMGSITGRLRQGGEALSPSDASAKPLTRRETQVADLLVEGLSNKEIARRLKIEVSTVKNHVHNILAKLRARSRTEASHLLKAQTAAAI